MNSRLFINIVLTIIGATISIIFILFGYSMLYENAPKGLIAFGFGTMTYGVSGIALLLLAWVKSQNYSQPVSLILSLFFIVAFFVASMDVGIISGLEWLGIFVVSLLSIINWLVVRTVTNFRRSA